MGILSFSNQLNMGFVISLLEAFRSSFPARAINIVYGRGREVASPIMKSGRLIFL
jgi:glyceraldehyde-3-phosphate dehydrogenase (NADP+)